MKKTEIIVRQRILIIRIIDLIMSQPDSKLTNFQIELTTNSNENERKAVDVGAAKTAISNDLEKYKIITGEMLNDSVDV